MLKCKVSMNKLGRESNIHTMKAANKSIMTILTEIADLTIAMITDTTMIIAHKDVEITEDLEVIRSQGMEIERK